LVSFPVALSDPDPDYKVAILFDINYVTNVASHSYALPILPNVKGRNPHRN